MNRLVTSLAMGAAAIALVGPARADKKGEEILRAAFKKLSDSSAMTATYTQTLEGKDIQQGIKFNVVISAKKPNSLLVKIAGKFPNGNELSSDFSAFGKQYVTYRSSTGQYITDVNPEKPNEYSGEWEAEVDAFFGGEKLLDKGTAESAGAEKIGKVDCDVVKMNIKAKGENPARTITYYVGQSDKLIYRSSYLLQIGADDSGKGIFATQANTMQTVNLKADLKEADFHYTPPSKAKKQREIIF